MPKIADILRFRDEQFFDGAVQLDWFYEPDKKAIASSSFVFHGPEYYAVSRDDIRVSLSLELVDTCSFAQMLAHRVYRDGEDTPRIMAIAGYGSGKSHLALTLASLFDCERDDELRRRILKNIYSADRDIGTELGEIIGKPNLVIALNGMKDFNLTYEILTSARKALKYHNVDETPLREITKAHEVARTFLERNFHRYTSEFDEAAVRWGLSCKGQDLCTYLSENLDSEVEVFDIVNEVFRGVTGASIRWDDGISAGDVLSKLQDTFCGNGHPFNKVLILFDEFGRYIEYASESPTRAGQSAIQQVFEATQNGKGNILFVGFIQSDLKTYLSRVEKSSNIVRYVGRFEASDKVYLSSNLETIFANLIERKDAKAFGKYVLRNQRRAFADWDEFHKDILRWLTDVSERAVWRESDSFRKVILEGTYPLHPITTWMLSNLSTWLQQRSALTFVNSELEALSHTEIRESSTIPVIYPIRLVQTEFFTELLRAEEEGRQHSEYCILYHQVLIKHKDKCSQVMQDILAANLILRIGKFRTSNRADAFKALAYCVPHGKEAIDCALDELESELGVLSFDETAGCFDFVEDAIGARDFRRFIQRLRTRTSVDLAVFAEVRKLLGIDSIIDTSFSSNRGIRTREWQYSQEIIPISTLSQKTIKSLKAEWMASTSPDKPKGKLVWVYIGSEDSADVSRLQEMIRANGLDDSPILFFLLDDGEGRFLNAVRDLIILNNLSEKDQAKYFQFVAGFRQKTVESIKDTFEYLQRYRTVVTGLEVKSIRKRLSQYCEDRFSQVYSCVIPFPFEGFHNKNIGPAKKLCAQIAKTLLTGKMDYQVVQSWSKDLRNRVEAVLVVSRKASWGVLTNDIHLIYPKNASVLSIYRELDDLLDRDQSIHMKNIFKIYTMPPYGLNEFGLGLLLACYIASKEHGVKVRLKKKFIKALDWAEQVYLDKGIDLKVLENTELVKVNIDESSKRWDHLCKLIIKTTDIQEIHNFGKELSELQQEQEVPKELISEIKACEVKVKTADELCAKVSKTYQEQYKNLESAARDVHRLDMHRLLEVASKCEDSSQVLPPFSRFTYSRQQVHQFEVLALRARGFIEEYFAGWLNSLVCESITHVDSFKTSMKEAVKYLRSLGYAQFAQMTENRLDSILADMHHIGMLQTIRSRIEEYLQYCRPSDTATYDQLMDWKRKGLELEDYVLTHQSLSSAEIAVFQARVSERLNQVEDCIAKLNDEVIAVWDLAFELSTIEDCRTLQKKIRDLFGRNIQNEDREYFEDIFEHIECLLDGLNRLDSLDLGRYAMEEEVVKLEDKWARQDSEIDLTAVIDSYWHKHKGQFDELDQRWSEFYIDGKTASINTWDVNRCVSWMDNTRLLPNYLRRETVEIHREISDMVQERLAALEIEGIVMLFKKLSCDQREKCLERLLDEIA